MNIVICEDIKENSEALFRFITKYFEEKNSSVSISVYENGDKFLSDFSAAKIKNLKIIFLDIYMPGTIGVDVARKIREKSDDIIIIFTTTSEKHGIDSYMVKALQYLVKPLDYLEVESVLDESMALLTDSLRSIEVSSDGHTVKVYFKDILYVETIDNELFIHTILKTVKCSLQLHEFEKQVDGNIFIRTHNNFIVNMRYIEDIDSNYFILINEMKVPICEETTARVKQSYRDYLTELSERM